MPPARDHLGRIVVENIREYGQAELAARYKSTAGSQAEQVDAATLDAHWAKVERDGYVIVENALDADSCDAIAADIRPRFVYEGGRNNFEGFATRRLYGIIAHTFSCNCIAEHPVALGLLDRLFEPNYLLSQLQAIDIMPGEAAQPPHSDDGFYPWPRPRRALGAATIFAIDDFTAENGATVLYPSSHTWDDRLPTAEDTAITATMPKGSMLFFLGTLWHHGGENRAEKPRLCVTAQYCAPFLRPQENFFLSVPPERAAKCSESMKRLLGYSVHPPFLGMTGGMHPKRVLEGL